MLYENVLCGLGLFLILRGDERCLIVRVGVEFGRQVRYDIVNYSDDLHRMNMRRRCVCKRLK